MKEVNVWWIFSGCLAVLLWFLSETYFGIRIEPSHERLETGIGISSFFKSGAVIAFSQVSDISIKQRPDKYYGIGFALQSGEFVELDKKATLDEATKRQNQIEKQINKHWS